MGLGHLLSYPLFLPTKKNNNCNVVTTLLARPLGRRPSALKTAVGAVGENGIFVCLRVPPGVEIVEGSRAVFAYPVVAVITGLVRVVQIISACGVHAYICSNSVLTLRERSNAALAFGKF